jgi:CheY-like chemotaxis protein
MFPPAAADTDAPKEHRTNDHRAPAERTFIAGGRAGDAMNILMVEDEELITSLLGRVLAAEGHAVETSDRGAQAIELFAVIPAQSGCARPILACPTGHLGRQRRSRYPSRLVKGHQQLAGQTVRVSAAPLPVRRRETLVVMALAAVVTVRAEWAILFNRQTFQPDALFHEWWMRQWRDPSLFRDPLTAAVQATGFVPPGVRAIDRVGALVLDPVTFSAWMPVVIVPICAWLVFALVRRSTDWGPAPWLGAMLFLAPVWVERFSGGHPRAYSALIVLSALYLAQRGALRAALVVPPIGALLYPAAAAVALGMLGFSVVLRRRPRVRSMVGVVLSATGAGLVIVLSGIHVPLSEAQARRTGEFAVDGQIHYYANDLLTYLSQNQSGFNLGRAGSMVAIAALASVILARRSLRCVPREVWTLIASCMTLFVLAHAFLFRLYLPNRYAQPLIPALAIVAAILWAPAWAAIPRRLRVGAAILVPVILTAVALHTFPLGARLGVATIGHLLTGDALLLAASCGVALVLMLVFGAARRSLMSACVAAALVAGTAYTADGGVSPTFSCKHAALTSRLAQLPKDAIIAGDPFEMNCVPLLAARSVVISQKLNQPLSADLARVVIPRMTAVVRAEYSPDPATIRSLQRFGADYLVVHMVTDRVALLRQWRNEEPFTSMIRGFMTSPAGPAADHLSNRCLIWADADDRLYNLHCLF